MDERGGVVGEVKTDGLMTGGRCSLWFLVKLMEPASGKVDGVL